MPTTVASAIAQLAELLSASRQNYDACLDHLDYQHTFSGVSATTRLHHLKLDSNEQPKVAALAKCLVNHAIDYALSARDRPEVLSNQDAMMYAQEARKLFRVVAAPPGTADLAGEAGELLLYFLLEAVIQAPQVVAKMELKTNTALEVNGSDGIHMRWHPIDGVVDIYFGESKMYADVGTALTRAFESIESFHACGMREHEYTMVTKHFKGVDDTLKQAVKEILDSGKPGPDARINHACLIGYNWSPDGLTPQQALEAVQAEYREQYRLQAPRLHRLLETRLNNCQRKMYRFEEFFLPFVSVQAFRDAFDECLR